MIGTLVNVFTVACGASIGLLLNKALPERIVQSVFTALGLFTCLIGISMALEGDQLLITILTLIIGGILGELLRLEHRVNLFIERVKTKVKGGDQFVEGLTSAFLLFCVGAMTILGCFDEGIRNNRDIIYTKSIMDFFSSIALASAFGRGVLFAVIPLFLYQGGLTLFSQHLEPIVTIEWTNQVKGIGGLLLIALGIQILDLRKFKLINYLPAFLIIPITIEIQKFLQPFLTGILT